MHILKIALTEARGKREREKTWLNADCNGYIELKKKMSMKIFE